MKTEYFKTNHKFRFIPKRTASAQGTLALLEGDRASCTPFVWRTLHPATFFFVSLVSRAFIPPCLLPFPLHALPWQHRPPVTLHPSHDSRIDVTQGILARLEGSID